MISTKSAAAVQLAAPMTGTGTLASPMTISTSLPSVRVDSRTLNAAGGPVFAVVNVKYT